MIEGLSGAFANTGEAVYRNLVWAVERVNNRGGIRLPASVGGNRMLALQRYDSKGQNEEVLSALRAASIWMQGFGQFEPVNLEAFERFLAAEFGESCGRPDADSAE